MLHWETVSTELKDLILFVNQRPAFNDFSLGGGTALALQLGHRISIDADFISAEPFDKQIVSRQAQMELEGVSDLHVGDVGVFLKSKGIKLDFLSWGLPFIRPIQNLEGLRIVSIEDIAAMKLFAITRRGEKKDYYDLAALLYRYSLTELFGFYHQRHKGDDTSLLLRFLVSFSDIDKQPEPHRLLDMDWNTARGKLVDATRHFLKK